MRIAAFESPLIAKGAQAVRGGLALAAFPAGDLQAHQQQDLQSAYRSGADWSDTMAGYALNTDLQGWGVAQIELDYHEDLVLAYQQEAGTTQCFALPVQGYTTPYLSPCPIFETLSALLAYVRCYFTIDTQLYWGKTPQGYSGIALHVLHNAEQTLQVPFVPMFDLHLAQAYSPLSSQLLEVAGTEWALRTLPASIGDALKDPRPLVTLGAQPYYQQAVSQKLLKSARWVNANRAAKQAEKSTRSVWETFLVPHQQPEGYLQQWQEILYRFLPLYCQWSERLAQQSASLYKRDLLTPYFERSVTPMGRLAQEMESLRGLAQTRLIQRAQQSPEATPLTVRELLRWPEFARRWQLFLNDYGHCGALDLAQPRIHEQQEQWLAVLLTPWCEGRPLSDLSWPQRLRAGMMWKDYALLYSLREKLWSDTLWALDQVKRRISPQCDEMSVGSSPVFSMFSEWCHRPLEQLTGEAEIAPEDLPPGLPLSAAPERLVSQVFSPVDRLTGTGLKTGLAQGLLWHGDPTAPHLPAGYLPAKTILCLPEVEAVHLPFIQQVAGVLLTRGNAFSQGSHLLREWNKPAIVQVRGACDLPEGTPIRLNSDLGVVDVLATV